MIRNNKGHGPFKVLTILGSPHDGRSNTRALVDDFVEEMRACGLTLEHEVISLGRLTVLPCEGCWNCTKKKACPLAERDDLEAIKLAMLDCDMLIVASPVYTNQVTAQMKALFDRLFTWCHMFPLLGTYGLSACTTGGDGLEETGAFLEKMLATYGVSSFGTISSKGGFTPGFFPTREMAREKNRKLARRAAETILRGQLPPVNRMQRKMFRVMKRKLMGIQTIQALHAGPRESDPRPPRLLTRLIARFIDRVGITEKQLASWAGLCSLELDWWRARGWLDATSFRQLAEKPVPEGFDPKTQLLALGRSVG